MVARQREPQWPEGCRQDHHRHGHTAKRTRFAGAPSERVIAFVVGGLSCRVFLGLRFFRHPAIGQHGNSRPVVDLHLQAGLHEFPASGRYGSRRVEIRAAIVRASVQTMQW